MELWWAAGVGTILGAVLSVLGGGGNVFLVPVLVVGFGVALPQAVGTAMVVVLIASSLAAVGHAWAGRVDGKVLVWFGGASMVGSYLGARLHPLAPQWLVLVILELVLIGAAVQLLWGKAPQLIEPRWIWRGLGVGAISSFVGVGGGFVNVPVLTAAGIILPRAVGTSVAVISLGSFVGAATYLYHGQVQLSLALAMGAGAALGAALGAPLSGRLPERPSRVALAAVILLAAGVMLWQRLTSLGA